MQQIDLPQYINSLGWSADEIILIDEAESISGAKRKCISRLYNLIINGAIGTIAVQVEDQLFHNETQIQVNVFIEAYVKNDVRMIIPYFKYNFADKYEGPYYYLLL